VSSLAGGDMDRQAFQDTQRCAEAASTFLEVTPGRGCGQVSLRAHAQFWEVAADCQCTAYLTSLVARLTAIERGDPKTALPLVVQLLTRGDQLPGEGAKAGKADKNAPDAQSVATMRLSLLTTLYFFALYFPFDPHHSQFVTCLRSLSQVAAADGGGRGARRSISENLAQHGASPHTAFILELTKMLSPAGRGGPESIISLVDQCCDITIPSDFDWWGNPQDISAAFLTQSFVHSFLRFCLARGDETSSNIVFDKVLLFLKHPGISESRLMVLLHMLFTFLIQSGTTHLDLLSYALSVVRQYFTWPLPFAEMVRSTLSLLTLELKSPGNALRRSLFSEHPELRPGTGAQVASSASGAAAAFRPTTGKEKDVYVLLDNLSLRAKQLQQLLESCQPPTLMIGQLRVNLLANIIGTQLSMPVESLDVHFLNENELMEAYEYSLAVLAEAIRAPTQEAAAAMKQYELAGLRDRIAATASPRRLAGEPATFHVPTYPALAPLDFTFRPVNVNNTAPAVDEKPFAKRSSVVLLQNIFAQYSDVARQIQEQRVRNATDRIDQELKPVVRIMVVGGDQILHNIAASWALIRATDGKGLPGGQAMTPGLLDELDVRFFFVPVDRSEFARFLGTTDVWYGRQVVSFPLAALRTLPSVALGATGDSSSASAASAPKAPVQRQHRATLLSSLSGGAPGAGAGQAAGPFAAVQSIQLAEDEDPVIRGVSAPAPSRVLREELQYFVREARQRLEIPVWLCACYTVSGGPVSFTVPFLQRCDLGTPAAARMFQQAKDLPSDWSTSRITASKGFKNQSVAVSVKHMQVNLVGQERSGPPMDKATYSQISIANVPIAGGEMGKVQGDPSASVLEVSLVEADASKKAKKTATYIGREASETAGVATVHAVVVELDSEDRKKTFNIVLDGCPYGPFARIRISRCLPQAQTGAPASSSTVDMVKAPITMPFMHFTPLVQR
jgi:Phosphoinositide 3-kinase gamma adapter protein p101 subunit